MESVSGPVELSVALSRVGSGEGLAGVQMAGYRCGLVPGVYMLDLNATAGGRSGLGQVACTRRVVAAVVGLGLPVCNEPDYAGLEVVDERQAYDMCRPELQAAVGSGRCEFRLVVD